MSVLFLFLNRLIICEKSAAPASNYLTVALGGMERRERARSPSMALSAARIVAARR